MSNKQILARNLRAIRIEKGLSAVEVATRAGISKARYSHYECAVHYPTSAVLKRLPRALGTTLKKLLADVGCVNCMCPCHFKTSAATK